VAFKFGQLVVWQMALAYIDLTYAIADKLPPSENYNLKSQLTGAVTSIALNIAEGSTGQSDPEQSRFPGMAIRSLIETVACQRIINRRNYPTDEAILIDADQQAQSLAKRMHAFRKALSASQVREDSAPYEPDEN
jgi:four helix bundle protein